MKTSGFSALILAAMLPTTALASVATERAFEAIHEPLDRGTSSTECTEIQPEALNTQGQSAGVTRTSSNIARATHHVTSLPASDDRKPALTKPLDR